MTVHENYMLIRDDEGWKIIHPQHGSILLGSETYDGLCIPRSLKFENAVVYNDELGDIGILNDVETVEDALDQLECDGHSKSDIMKMNPRREKVALFD